MARPKIQHGTKTPDEGLYLVTATYAVNGTTDPTKATMFGDELATVTRSSAGKWAGTLKTKPARCLGAFAAVSATADGVDIYARVDWSTVVSAGTFTVRTLTGAVQTDPADTTLITVFFVCKQTTRRARKK